MDTASGKFKPLEGTIGDIEPILENEVCVGLRFYFEYDGKRIAERVYKFSN
ncbi:MAG: hypothetical protein AAB897_00670 [Patescibacteria group bacterium]